MERTETQRQAEQEAMRFLNKFWAETFGGGASYRYYTAWEPKNDSRKKDKYFYTVSKVTHKGLPRYVSGIYRYNASKRQWLAMREAGHAKKKAAIERARRLSEQSA